MPDAAMQMDSSETARLVLPSVRRRLPRIAQQVTEEIRTTVPGFADSDHRQQLVSTAVNSAAAYFLGSALGEPVSSMASDDLFRKMGFREGGLGADLSSLDSAVRVAAGTYWAEIRVEAARLGVSPYALEDLRDALDVYVDHLLAQARQGHVAGSAAREQDSGLARRRLVDGLLAGADPDDIVAYAEVALWPLPPLLVVAAVELPGGARLDPSVLPSSVLCRTASGRAALITSEDVMTDAIATVRSQLPAARFAVCWPVEARDAPAAYRWTQRALALASKGILPARPVLDCRAYRTEIWLHAEPVMRRQLAQELLQPLLEETPNSREILSETLLVWLETRDSAPAIAARLGVHPQTVRYRWRRINQLFGEALHDPEYVVQLTLVLKASIALWVAGDQSDFERYSGRVQ
ncbi:helix-turn-helix domain-containing protein [Nocardioides carbamazepini]|uniref:PucR family transcriptional regulator n=1 Tax=Nocardioides carbamazepini TaxID=2854259 RepID=UPI00214A7CC5|nr:PucR family transcriptional regulator [Nocardioides carbamazepini]MCR1786514.1 helix-turn-helix domain-containing protein [Nocardioides carbamazepini]